MKNYLTFKERLYLKINGLIDWLILRITRKKKPRV